MKVAVCQFGATPDIPTNTEKVVAFAKQAADQGAELLVTPEASMIRLFDKSESLVGRVEELDGSFGTALAKASEDYKITIASGGFTPGDSERVVNTLFVAQDGKIAAHYDKIHLYDAFADKESDKVKPGPLNVVTVDVNGTSVGLTTCYDLRFPEIFRLLMDQGAQVVVVPAAWVKGSMKEEHWLTLLRARAIENTCFLVGSGECGERSVGRSAVFDPMGRQLTDLGGGEGMIVVDLDIASVSKTREINPSLANRRFQVVGTEDREE